MLSSLNLGARVARSHSARRTFSVAAGLDLGLPERYGHFIDGGFVERNPWG